MNEVIITVLVVFGFLLLISIPVLIRFKNRQGFEIKNPDIVFAVTPIIIGLLLTGQIEEFGFGGMRVAFANASKASISAQVQKVKLPVETVSVEAKGSTSAIPALISHQTEALSFHMGRGGYWGPAIEEYLEKLTRFPYLKHCVVEYEDGTFFGMIGANILSKVLDSISGFATVDEFADWLNSGASDAIAAIPGFITAEHAITRDSDKRSVLATMDSLNVETLPVVDRTEKFVGIVDRSRLTTSMLIEATKNLE